VLCVITAMEELLSCKLQSNLTAGIELKLYKMWWKSPMASHNQKSVLCGEQPNAIVRLAVFLLRISFFISSKTGSHYKHPFANICCSKVPKH
jgi:hypothetical protein